MHEIEAIEISGGVLTLVCSCGWRSEEYPDSDGEPEARLAWYGHAGIEVSGDEIAAEFGPHAAEMLGYEFVE